MFDLPDPLGPEMVVNPSRSGTTVAFPNDLKLSSSISLIRKRVSRYHFHSRIRPFTAFSVKNFRNFQHPGRRRKLQTPVCKSILEGNPVVVTTAGSISIEDMCSIRSNMLHQLLYRPFQGMNTASIVRHRVV